MKFRETDLFKQNVGLIREKRGGVEMVSCEPMHLVSQLTESVPHHVQSLKFIVLTSDQRFNRT